MEKVQYYQSRLDRELSRYQAFNDLEAKTGVSKVYTTVGVSSVLFILIFFDLGAQLIVNLAGFAYPAFKSLKALESARKTDDANWLTYWIVFGLFNTLEYFKDSLMYYIPFYYMLKLAFLLWLYLPFTNGAQKVYLSVLRPVVVGVLGNSSSAGGSTKKAATSSSTSSSSD